MVNKNLILSDEKLRMVLSAGQVSDHTRTMTEPLYDFVKLLDLFKERYKNANIRL
jgi:hypothetical protein